jgi:phage baseplate assembly protein W
MAFNPVNINPIDLIPQKAVGIDLPLNGSAVFKPNYQTKDAIKSNLINYLLTKQNERIGNPNFGSNLKDFLFTQLKNNSFDFFKEDIQNRISNKFPLVKINSISITSSNQNNVDIINIYLEYSIINTNIQDNLNISFS